jgi:preprotein translocase subunit YajC
VDLVSLLPFLLILVFFWLIIVRPARNRQRSQAQLMSNLTPGQKVMTTSGLFATVVGIEDDALVLETSPGVTSRWAKAAVSRIIPADSDVEDFDADQPDGEQPDVQEPDGALIDGEAPEPAQPEGGQPDGADDVRPPTA